VHSFINVALYGFEDINISEYKPDNNSIFFKVFDDSTSLQEFYRVNHPCFIVTNCKSLKVLKKEIEHFEEMLKIVIVKDSKKLIKLIQKQQIDKYMYAPLRLKEIEKYISKIYKKDNYFVIDDEDNETLKSRLQIQKKELESSMALLESYKKAVDAGTILSKTDTKGVITYVNDQFCNISGYSKEELIGKPHNIIRHPDNPPGMFKDMWETIQNKNIWHGEVKNKTKNGNHYWVDATIIPIINEKDEIIEYVALRHNITEVMDYKELLEEKVAQKTKEITKNIKILQEYKNAVDASSIMSKTDITGKITFINDEFCKVAKYDKNELLGKPHNIVRHPDMPKEAFKQMWETILDKKIWKGVVKNRAKDGTAYWVHATIVPILDEKDNIVEFVGIRQDITELMSYRLELEQKVQQELEKNREKDVILQQQSARAAIGEMVNSIAHQWRQPINSISLEATNIMLDVQTQNGYEDIGNSATKISFLTKTMSQTITDFMEFSNPNREVQSFVLKECVGSIQKMLESQLFSKNIRYINGCDTQLRLTTFKNDLKQVIINLVNNAKDAFEDNAQQIKEITVEAYEEKENFVTINVTDNAGGIPEHISDKIFEPYFTTKSKDKGTGLGLYISRKIVTDQLKGTMTFEPINGGTKFSIRIPKTIEAN
jgi:PAS domain S-box-containing protein